MRGARTQDAEFVRPDLSHRAVTRLLVVLTTASGCLDVFCVTQLGGFFASVITGNLVQLGHNIVAMDSRLLSGGSVAVGGYAIGVAGGTLPLRHAELGWRSRTHLVMVVQVLLLVGVAGGWWATGGRPGFVASLTLLFAAATASGIQSVVTISSGIPHATTTYLTGSLTSIVRGVVFDPHRFAAGAAGVTRLLGLLGGAVLGAAVLRVAPLWAPALAAALVAAVLATATAVSRSRRRLPSRSPGEDEQQDHREDRADQHRAEAAKSVGEEDEHGGRGTHR
ncbi:YoaK family protein [Salinispora pacifica]|uniref:YoaK family protein n=1 Tax=Salinispora pacifica TaxID=351187 RepID=UPI00036C303F|nr:YoaK family protein [Salinispora pacifica]